MKKNFYIIILSLFIYNCESDLITPQFEIYLCSVEDVQVSLINSSNLQINWKYPDANDAGCDQSADNFIINYLISDDLLSSHPSNLPESVTLPFDYQSSGNYSYQLPISDVNKNYYFSLQVNYLSEYSVQTPNAQGSFLFSNNFGAPYVSDAECDDQLGVHDNDCFAVSLSNSSLNIEDYNELYINERIKDSNGDIVRIEEIELTEQEINNSITRNLFQDYLACAIGTTYNDLYNCSGEEVLKPNETYTVEYYYSQIIDGVETESAFSDPLVFIFDRLSISIDQKPISDSEIRIYIENSDQMEFYNFLLIWEYGGDNTIGNIKYEIDISDHKENKVFDNYIHVDLENVTNDFYFIGLKGTESFYVLDSGEISFELLLIPGFRLIDYEGENSDFYMSTYELTQNDYNNGASAWMAEQSIFPAEINKQQCETYINDLNNSFPYIFKIPNNTEWEYAAGKNIYTNEMYVYPWGNDIESNNANYFNSDYPLSFSGSNGPSPVGYFITFPSPFGLYDMSGNVMEWVDGGGNTIVGKGGNYYSGVDELRIDYIEENVLENTSSAMGCRVILEIN